MSGAMGPERPWYREPWPWLLMLPPALSIAGGVVMLVLAVGEPADLVVADYGRIDELTTERFARDARAADTGWTARVVAEHAGGTKPGAGPEPDAAFVAIAVHLAARETAALPDALHLGLQHAAHGAADREIVLARGADDAYHGVLELAAGRYAVELSPLDRVWRLGGSLRSVPATLELRAAGAHD